MIGGMKVTVTDRAMSPAILGAYGLLPARWSPHRSRRKIKKHWKKTSGLIEIEPATPRCYQVGVGVGAYLVMHPILYRELEREIERQSSQRLMRNWDDAIAGPLGRRFVP